MRGVFMLILELDEQEAKALKFALKSDLETINTAVQDGEGDEWVGDAVQLESILRKLEGTAS
jgi:hypothetical protein